MVDCFGRSLHAQYKDDGAGIGAFTGNCTTLKVCDFNIPKLGATQRELVKLLYDLFCVWGEIADIHFNSAKCIGFVKYKYQIQA